MYLSGLTTSRSPHKHFFVGFETLVSVSCSDLNCSFAAASFTRLFGSFSMSFGELWTKLVHSYRCATPSLSPDVLLWRGCSSCSMEYCPLSRTLFWFFQKIIITSFAVLCFWNTSWCILRLSARKFIFNFVAFYPYRVTTRYIPLQASDLRFLVYWTSQTTPLDAKLLTSKWKALRQNK